MSFLRWAVIDGLTAITPCAAGAGRSPDGVAARYSAEGDDIALGKIMSELGERRYCT